MYIITLNQQYGMCYKGSTGDLRKKRYVADSNRVEYYLSLYREIEEREIK